MNRVPVTVLAGFLGAGKTTLLNRILRADHGVRVAVLVNDFGAIDIDSQLIVGVEGETVSLVNGCICCTIRGDLLRAALDVLARPEPPEYLLIEASGVSDPAAVAATFLCPDASPSLRLDSVITVVDAAHTASQRRYAALLYDQIFAADVIVLNKIDLVGDVERERLKRWIGSIVPRARILETSYGQAPLELLLGVGRFRMTLDLTTPSGACTVRPHQHDELFGSWSYASDRPFKLGRLRRALVDLPPAIFRAKGLLAMAESPARQTLLQLVGSRITLAPGAPWGTQPPRTQLALIGTPIGVDPIDLTRRFEACLTRDTPQTPVEIAWEWIRDAWQL